MMMPIMRPKTCRQAGIAVAAIVDVRRDTGTIGDATGMRIIRGATIEATGGRKPRELDKARRRHDHSLRPRADVRRLHAQRAFVFTGTRIVAVRSGLPGLRSRGGTPSNPYGGRLRRQVRSRGGAGGWCGIDGGTGGWSRTGSVQRCRAAARQGGMLGAMAGARGKAFVDFQNDVTAKDIALAVREGFRSIEHIKRYTTTGMATDQGKTSNVNALGIAADALAMVPEQVGLTTFRPPYTPVTFGSFAGASRGMLFDPVRETPLHDRAVALGAVFEDVGQWRRALYIPRRGETMHDAVARECRAVRDAAGMFDGSTLGKIEVVGPDAGEFLDRIYVNSLRALQVGRCRYGILLREDGFVLDDGIIGRLATDRFHVTTTTGGAARVLAVMEDYLQTEWSELDVWLTSVTEHWAVIGVQGPRAREVLAPLVQDIDLTLPHMALAEGHICGVPTRLFRVSFTGERGFEVNVPAEAAGAVWDAIAAGGITPYGTEAMHVLRAEKGYIIAGQEADGTTTPDDLGLTWAIGKTKRDFVGKRSLGLLNEAAQEYRDP
jgi:sarcosine oxidase subunit alpha